MQRELGFKMEAVPYRGGAPAAAAVAAGDVPLAHGRHRCDPADDRRRPGGRARRRRADALEVLAGHPDLAGGRRADFGAPSWLALFVPRGTPEDRVARLNAEFARIAALPEAQKVLSAAGLELSPSSPGRCAASWKRIIKKWGELIQATGLKALSSALAGWFGRPLALGASSAAPPRCCGRTSPKRDTRRTRRA